MVSSKQCETARLMTNDTTSDVLINSEYASMSDAAKNEAAIKIDELAKTYTTPFDMSFPLMVKDFAQVASQYNISKATLFCVYMAYKSAGQS